MTHRLAYRSNRTDRIAPDLVAPTVRLVLPKSGGAYGTSHDIAGLVINCDRGVDHLHVVIEAHSPAVVGCKPAQRTIVASRQFADMKPIEAHDRIGQKISAWLGDRAGHGWTNRDRASEHLAERYRQEMRMRRSRGHD